MDDEGIELKVNEKDLGLIRDILRTITKTIKTFNVYPKDNPIYQKFATELFEKFSTFFESNDELGLDVEQYSLLYKENEVFQSEERADNIALLLFADGIRQINFYKGITFDEITDFIDILKFVQKSKTNDDDDIVTLLWEKNIKNMGYTALEDTVDDDLAVEESLLQEGLEMKDFTETTVSSKSYSESAIETVYPEFKIEPLTQDELETIKDELSGIEEKSLLSSAADLFFELLKYEKDMEAFPEIMHNIGKILDIRIQKKDIHGALEILEGLKNISTVYDTSEQSEIINTVVSKAGNLENLRILFRASPDTAEIRQYLLYLGKHLIPNMIQMLGELEDRKQRRLLCEILAEMGKQDIDVFSVTMNDNQWYLVRNIVMILGMTKDPAALKYLEQGLRHPELRVRREAVKAIVGIQSEETKKLFLMALKDDDLTVRITALKALKRFKDPALFQALRGNISREELKKKSFEEKKEMLETLAVLGGESAFLLLSDLFRKKGLIEKAEITEIRASAAYGLGLIGTPQALSLLEKETRSRKSILREACLKALRELQQSGDNSR
jgi:HEAT repeat protein